ncbi:hypothetical protein ACOME3_005911 [Neoechinorhynchus agilis]
MNSSSLDDNDQSFTVMYCRAKKYAKEGELEHCLRLLIKCQSKNPSDRLNNQIKKVKDAMTGLSTFEYPSEPDIPTELINTLHPYQTEGLKWLWNLFIHNQGGILADEMGLGKTIQIIALIRSIETHWKCRQKFGFVSLIVVPLSVVSVWTAEFNKWSPSQLYPFNERGERKRALSRISDRGGSLIITFNLLIRSLDIINARQWDLVVIDEGHKLRNNQTLTARSVRDLRSDKKFILTGTAIQNNLEELWSLINIVGPSGEHLLGTREAFRMDFENVITSSRQKDSCAAARHLGQVAGEKLRRIVQPYILRRTKSEVLIVNDKNEPLVRKYDLIVWCNLSECQRNMYLNFLTLDKVKYILNSVNSPLVALSVLKAICDHPRVGGLSNWNMVSESIWDKKELACKDVLLEESGKLTVAYNLLCRLVEEGHRNLVFSRSVKMLNILEKVLVESGLSVLRLDGRIKSNEARERIIARWQESRRGDPMVMLLTTQVGGVGITLTAADRVIIYDPSWNPASDDQAVDRACRIGQTNPVIIYRLISCGTIEEKIYRRQIFKRALFETVMNGETDPIRYFSKDELRNVFTVRTIETSTTREYVINVHGDIAQDGDEYIRHECELLRERLGSHFHGVSDNVVINKIDENAAVKESASKIPRSQTNIEKSQVVRPLFKPVYSSDGSSPVPVLINFRKTEDESDRYSNETVVIHSTASGSHRFHTTTSMSTYNEHSGAAGGIAFSTPDGAQRSKQLDVIVKSPELSKIKESSSADLSNVVESMSRLQVEDSLNCEEA